MKRVYVTAALLAGCTTLLFAAEKSAATPAAPVTKLPTFPAKLPTFGEPDLPDWTRVNEKKRHRMPERFAIPCMPWTGNGIRGPHGDKFVEVFVNDIGKNAMASEPILNPANPDALAAIRFPAGSIIIKVKYDAEKGGAPVLRTVMIKREPGYNPSCGDWEFVATSGDGQQIAERGKIDRCMACHKREPETDFTFINDYRPRPAKPAK